MRCSRVVSTSWAQEAVTSFKTTTSTPCSTVYTALKSFPTSLLSPSLILSRLVAHISSAQVKDIWYTWRYKCLENQWLHKIMSSYRRTFYLVYNYKTSCHLHNLYIVNLRLHPSKEKNWKLSWTLQTRNSYSIFWHIQI